MPQVLDDVLLGNQARRTARPSLLRTVVPNSASAAKQPSLW